MEKRQLTVSGRSGLPGVSAQRRVERVSSLGTGSAPARPVWALTERTGCASPPRATVSVTSRRQMNVVVSGIPNVFHRGPFQATVAGASGATGRGAPGRAAAAFGPGGESATAPVRRGRGATARGWERRSRAATLTTVQVCSVSIGRRFSFTLRLIHVLFSVAPCSQVPGTAFSSCGPSCPRSCEDLAVGIN